jgi:hypothetical protein
LGNIIDEAVLAVERFVDFAQDPVALKAFLEEFGWTPDSLPKPVADLAGASASLVEVITSEDTETSLSQALSAIKKLVDAVNAIRSNPDNAFPSGIDVAAFKQTIGRDLVDYLLVEHLLTNHYRLGGLLRLAGIIRLVPIPASGLRKAYLRREIPWGEIGDLFSDPTKGFHESFAWGSAAPQVPMVLGLLASLLESYGLRFYWVNATQQQLVFLNGGATAPVTEMLGSDLAVLKDSGLLTDNVAGVQLFPRPATSTRADGLAILPYVQSNTSQTIALSDRLSLSITGDADFTKGISLTIAPASAIELESGFFGGGATHPAKLQAQLSITPPADEPENIIFGTADGSRLSVAKGTFTAAATLVSQNTLDASVQLDLENLHIVIKPEPGDADSFLASFLPDDGISTTLSMGLRISSLSGFHFTGSGALQGTFPLHLQLGPVNVLAVSVALKPNAQGLALQVGALLSGSIGPLSVVVDSASFALSARFPDPPNGNLGPLDVGFGFAPPSGAGLSVDAAGISGGGFLAFDPGAHQYSGVLQLEFNELALQAFGLIATQAAGQTTYSLLALIDAEFPPIQLGWGFTLDGVGGLLAVNRSASTDALHAALKANTLSSILFPTNAITNAPLILGTLSAIFPPAPGRFVFGPMALIGWGSPVMLRAAIAVILELPEPIRIILIARVSVHLPSEDEALVRLNMDALGILDLSQDSLSLDATLFDSKLIEFTLSGDMALRANWASSQRTFLLAVGGCHPQFTPPPGFPALQRITIDMPSGPVSKLRLAAYLALSSNTIQFGATLDVFIGVSGFGLSGHLGFDALLQRDPLHFDVDISGRVALTAGGDDLMSIGLDATLSGPAPWHIAGDFKIHIVFFDVHKSFSHSWGDDAPALPIVPVDVLSLLTAELADARNWGAPLLATASPLVSLTGSDTSVVHPLALLEVHESVVPLNLTITRYGSAAVSGATSFTITDYQVNGKSIDRQPVEDDFAPAQFFDLSDDDKLARPSFETHDAGVRSTGAGLVACGAPVSKTISYETFYIDQPNGILRTDPAPAPKPFGLGDLTLVLAIGASGRATIRAAGNRRYSAPGNPLKIAPQMFVITDKSSLSLAGIGPTPGTTYSEAAAFLRAAIAQKPAQIATLQIVAKHELAAA